MDKFVIHGREQLNGEVIISGAKNAVLPIMAATLITPGKFTLRNVPDLRDTRTMIKLLEIIGAKIEFADGVLKIDTIGCDNPVAPYEVVKTMRASFDVLGPLLGRFQYAKVSLPGGCAWGPRPVDLHLKAMKILGAEVTMEGGYIIVKGSAIGGDINFEISSVGATKNALMAAVKAKGETVIHNAAREPEISALVDFLNALGAKITRKDTTCLCINGVQRLSDELDFTIIPDRIEAGTFLITNLMVGGEIKLIGVNPDHLSIVLTKLKEAGSKLEISQDSIITKSTAKIKPVDITTGPYPGFPTDLQAQWMALMSKAAGASTVIDEIYRDRFTHVAELNRLGARIKLEQNVAEVVGVTNLTGAPVMSTDIRASASLIIAALAATGKTEVSRIYHIDRGYEKIEKKLELIGADIKRAKS